MDKKERRGEEEFVTVQERTGSLTLLRVGSESEWGREFLLFLYKPTTPIDILLLFLVDFQK